MVECVLANPSPLLCHPKVTISLPLLSCTPIRPITVVRAVHGLGGLGLCPTRNRPVYSNGFVGLGCQWVVSVSSETENHRNLSKCNEVSPDPMRSYQICPRFSENSSDLVRFPPNHTKKSLIQLDLMYIIPEISRIAKNVAENLGKMVGVDGLQAGRVSRVLERGDLKSTCQRQDLSPTAGFVGSSGSESGSGE